MFSFRLYNKLIRHDKSTLFGLYESFVQACYLVDCKKIIRHDKSTFFDYTRALFKQFLLLIVKKIIRHD
jgi:hypothetical protein